MTSLHVYAVAYPVTALGPGKRIALWVSGCPLGCKGCITPELWDREAGYAIDVEEVLARLLAIDIELDGITLTGGEPFEQAAALATLLRALGKERPHWNILVFSGYSLHELRKRPDAVNELLPAIDVLIAGRYVAKRPSDEPLVASTNQQRHYLSACGRSLRESFEAADPSAADLAVGSGGQKLLIGVVDPDTRARLHHKLEANGETQGHSNG